MSDARDHAQKHSATPGGAGSDRLRLATAVLATIGLGIAIYLTYVHYRGIKVLCLSSGGCETVQASRFAKVGGVPVALIGLIGYVSILASLALRGETGALVTLGLVVIGWGFSAYLTYRELFTIDAICQWCVGSAVIMTLLLVISAIRYLRVPLTPP
jgi:uncharacterized membrane protein